MTVQLAFSTNAFKQQTVEQAVLAIAGIGYRGVEIMADAPHMQSDCWTDAQVRRLRQLVDDLGLTVSNVNAFTGYGLAGGDTYHPTWIEPDPAVRQVRIDYTRRAVEQAAILGASTVSLQPGGPYQGRDIQASLALFADGIDACLPTAEACDVVLAIEPEPGLLIERSDQFADWKGRFFADAPRVMLNADMGHFFCVGEDPVRVIEQCHQWICHVHLEDIVAGRIHQHRVPGEGVMDFPGIFAALDRFGYQQWATVELYPYVSSASEVAEQAWRQLNPMLSE